MATKTITIDVWRPLRESITVVQREGGARTLSFRIMSSGAALDLTGKTVTFYATKPDDSIVFNACTTTSAAAGKCTYLVTAQTVAVAGELTACLIITGASYELRTQDFAITIDSSPDYTSAVESLDEFTALAALAGDIASNTSRLDGIIDLIYPVGSIYTSVVATNPGTLFGVGTWVAFGAGRVPVGLDAGQTEFDTVEETGGAKTHTLAETEIPAHDHDISFPVANTTPGANLYYWPPTGLTNTDPATQTSMNILDAGGGQAHNNLQPYIVVRMWKRTA